jgi:Flp pilus assembly protein TadB
VLSERERRALADIERQVCAEDPVLARCLRTGVPRRTRPAPVALGVVALPLALLGLVASLVFALPVATAATAVLTAALAGILWWQSRARRHPNRS